MKAEEQECIDRADVFFNDVMKHIGNIALQDYQNMNELGILLTKLRTKKEEE